MKIESNFFCALLGGVKLQLFTFFQNNSTLHLICVLHPVTYPFKENIFKITILLILRGVGIHIFWALVPWTGLNAAFSTPIGRSVKSGRVQKNGSF